MERTRKTEGVRKLWEKYKFVALVVLTGAVLLLWPSGDRVSAGPAPERAQDAVWDIQREMEEILGHISGVGEVRLMLTVDADGDKRLAQDTELSYRGSANAPEDYTRRSETVLVDSGTGDDAVVTGRTYPIYRGALVVCQGGGQAAVKLAVTEAVAALTGLPADRITVAEWQ